MRRTLPPLNALRSFEAAARHLSFTRAARELHVTQAAVSHQVRVLEDHLGVRLFQRLTRALALTAAGAAYLPSVRDAFDRLDDATAALIRTGGQQMLRVSTLPSFAVRWLVPRLGRFRDRHPEIDVWLATTPDLVDFARDDVDLAIRYGRGRWHGVRADRLLDDEVVPVAIPTLARRLRRPADLAKAVLLHDDSHADWRTWLLAAGVTTADPARGPVFTDSSMLIQAAVSGQGIALARRVLAAGELAAGRLVRLFDRALPQDFAYYIVYAERRAGDPRIRAFRDWLLTEIDIAITHGTGTSGAGPQNPARPR